MERNAFSVHPVGTRKALRDFLSVPYRIYAHDPNWVPPLLYEVKRRLSPRHPFFRHAECGLFLAKGRGGVLGRIGACVNRRHNEVHGEKAGFFGFFESIREPRVARILIDAASRWLRERGMKILLGPADFSLNDECGLLIEGFDTPPVLMMPYNPSYYPELLEGAGLEKAKDLFSYDMQSDAAFDPRVLRLEERLRLRSGASFRTADMSRYRDEMATVQRIYSEAWRGNWGFVPMTEEEFARTTRDLKPVLDPRAVFFAVVDGKDVGCSVAVPDINLALRRIRGRLTPRALLRLWWYARKIRRLRFLIFGVLEAYRGRGLETLLFLESFRRGIEAGYPEAEVGWTLEDNVRINRLMEAMGGRRTKRYRIYQKAL